MTLDPLAGQQAAQIVGSMPAAAPKNVPTPCDPSAIDRVPGYWLGRAAVRTAEALRPSGTSTVPADDDLRQHRMAAEYEARARECAA